MGGAPAGLGFEGALSDLALSCETSDDLGFGLLEDALLGGGLLNTFKGDG